ncbi:MAG: S8 family serine peptidase [candidate division Zixibacteria bacterium]|nr:S8 family serine peptidase [candidate division Zixibacteria bacterium]
MKVNLRYILLFFVIAAIFGLTPLTRAMSPVLSPGLERLVSNSNSISDSLVDIVVFLDGSGLKNQISKVETKGLSHHELIQEITSTLRAYQTPDADLILRFLNSRSAQPVKKYWVVPAMTARLPVSHLETLATMSSLELVVENATLSYESPVEIKTAPMVSASVSTQLQLLNVPSLWQKGLTGTGRLICSFDTGVEQDHPALALKWRGNNAELSASWFSKVRPDSNPTDKIGHGTHTMGIMVGSVDDDTIGVAPDAEWISAGVIDQGRDLNTTISDIIEAFQWALDPDGDSTTTEDVPDVILNSWGIPKGLFTPCDQTFTTVISNVEAAGIVTVFAAGNEGPNSTTMRNPADMSLTPLTSFAVGAVDNNSEIAGFSSRGPSSCDENEIKPEVVAPGVSVRSSDKDGGYKVMSGTSMAAPYIAGLVALMRQYNPNATVEEIKNALIASAVDLGQAGEDNAYGHGLVDASELIKNLPDPNAIDFELSDMNISDDGIASPGETFELNLIITSSSNLIGTVNGNLISTDIDGATILSEESSFSFGHESHLATATTPFTICLNDNLYNGIEIPLNLCIESTFFSPADTVEFILEVGISPGGIFATHSTNQIDLTVSDFAQYGLASGSIYNVDGDGFRVNGSNNLLYEAGIILGHDAANLSTSIRDSLGHYAPSDFAPNSQLSDSYIGAQNGDHRVAVFSDMTNDILSGITIRQETISYPYIDDNGMVIFRYHIINNTEDDIEGLSFGMMVDYDLMKENDRVVHDSNINLMYQITDSGPYVGLVGLSNINSSCAINNSVTESCFSDSNLFESISSSSVNETNDTTAGDWLFIVGSGALTVLSNDSVEIALAMVGGSTYEALIANTNSAHDLYRISTNVTDTDNDILPVRCELHQNYPNPFNPTTNIDFNLTCGTEVTLEIFNILGRRVKTLYSGYLDSGSHRFEWDAVNEKDDAVATGVYFYKLSTPSQSETRKMLFLK